MRLTRGSHYLFRVSLGVLLGMAYGPTMLSQPSELTKPRPVLEWRLQAAMMTLLTNLPEIRWRLSFAHK